MALLVVLCLSVVFALGMVCAKLTSGKAHVQSFISSLSLGAMAGVAFLDLIPEIVEETTGYGYILVGVLCVLGIVILCGNSTSGNRSLDGNACSKYFGYGF